MPLPCPTVDPDGVPNLDAMEDLELLEFYQKHKDGAEHLLLFNDAVVGVVPAQHATLLLSQYAWNLYLARLDRHDGKMPRAQSYEAFAQHTYELLPEWARW